MRAEMISLAVELDVACVSPVLWVCTGDRKHGGVKQLFFFKKKEGTVVHCQ